VSSRFKLVLLATIIGLGCNQPGAVSPPPPPPPPPPNSPPVAVAGGPYTSSSGVINVDGSQSSDPDGNPITFRWNFGDGTSGDSARMTHTYQTSGDYTISLVVSDNQGAKDTATTSAGIVIEQGAVLVGAGNIASCGVHDDENTANLIDAIPGTVFTTGDNVLSANASADGTDSQYVNCYGPSWGRFLSRTRPTLGNHDYAQGNSNAEGSFAYFGDKLGPPGLGYYSYDLGTWHIIVLNDHGDTDPVLRGLDATQTQWLTDDLNAHPNQCTLAMFHVARFISSNTPAWTDNPGHKPLWDLLYSKGVDVVLNGQQHNYERFAPMTPNGDLDPTSGIREFNVGTGGDAVDNFTVIHPHSETRAAVFGVLKLTLKTSSYDWQFVPVAGETYTDSGSGTCH
jgi:hypothetical protein